MNRFPAFSGEIPLLDSCDVLVVGSGTAGIAAAVASARKGADTLLIDQYGFLGGTLSSVNVQSYSFSLNQNPGFLTGIPQEIIDRAEKFGATQPDYRGSGVFINSELYKCMLDEWMAQEGVRVLFYCTVCGADVAESTVKGVYVCTKNGIVRIGAKRVVDATGDGDVAFFSGAPFMKRPREQMQPVTVAFGIGGVDLALFRKHCAAHKDRNDPDYGFRPILRKAAETGEWVSRKRGGAWKTVREEGEIESLNIIACFEIDATDVCDTTKAEIEGRKQVVLLVGLFRKYGAEMGLKNCYLRNVSPQLGVRETRRIEGDYVLTGDDVRNSAKFADRVGSYLRFMDAYRAITLPEHGETFEIPCRILLPRGLENILTAGRCVSCDEEAFGALRLMPCCAVTGEAAGTIAAVSVAENVTPRALAGMGIEKYFPREK